MDGCLLSCWFSISRSHHMGVGVEKYWQTMDVQTIAAATLQSRP